jgi:plasmid stabilization system protein ParE
LERIIAGIDIVSGSASSMLHTEKERAALEEYIEIRTACGGLRDGPREGLAVLQRAGRVRDVQTGKMAVFYRLDPRLNRLVGAALTVSAQELGAWPRRAPPRWLPSRPRG